MMASDESGWRNTILNSLHERNKLETGLFTDIIALNSRLFDSANCLRGENLQLSIQNEKLRTSNGGVGGGLISGVNSERIQLLEQRLLTQQEELTSLHRRRGENAQQIINLNTKLQEAEKAIHFKDESLSHARVSISSLELDVSRLHTSLKELKSLEQHLRDEHQALQITCAALEEKLRKAQDENRQLVERLIKYKAKDADKMNEDNENFLKIRGERMRRELEDAVREAAGGSSRGSVCSLDSGGGEFQGGQGGRAGSPSRDFPLPLPIGLPHGPPLSPFHSGQLPSKVVLKFVSMRFAIHHITYPLVAQRGGRSVNSFEVALGMSEEEWKVCQDRVVWRSVISAYPCVMDAHDSEVNAVKFSPTDRIVATGGADRKLKLWDVSNGACKSKGVLVGSNAAVMSVDFNSTGTMILGASNDFASRVWTVSDQRLRHSLTGHSGKVMAAKFLGESSKVITGSHDRTLKIWDLRSRACIETKFAGSSCNDLVTSDGSGSTIISGHFDKSIRFWDTRSDATANQIMLQGKVTSLDLSRDCNYLLACVRDDTIKLLDLRMNAIIGSFSNDAFKVGCDWARAAFSPDGRHIAAGGADGSVFLWAVSSIKLDSILKGEHSTAVTSVAWHPHGSSLISVDRSKRAVLWGDQCI